MPGEAKVLALDPGPQPGTWTVEGVRAPLKCCGNRELAAQLEAPSRQEVGPVAVNLLR